MISKRKICFPITSRVHFARQKHLLDLLRKNPKIDLQIVVGGSLLSEKYGEHFLPEIQKAGFAVQETLFNLIEGGNHIAMAKTAGLMALEFANSLNKLNPDIVLIRGDRFEQLAMAMVAVYLNKTIAHIEGGDLTGTIDESVRHAITKLAHIHFVTNEISRKRVIRMGENPKSAFNVGSLDIEFAALCKKNIDLNTVNNIGAGYQIDFLKPFLMVMYHPVTTESNNRLRAETLLKVADRLDIPTLWFWPNHDAGTNEIAKAKALVGNSSSGIKECSYFGVPTVNVGTRQQGRMRGENVLDVGYGGAAIASAIEKQLTHGPYKPSALYHRPNTSKKILETMLKFKGVDRPQKKFYEI